MSIDVPQVDQNNFIPNLPRMEKRDHNWMGKVVHWIRDSRRRGPVQKIAVLTMTFFLSLGLMTSIVLTPLLLYGFKEFVRQEERARYDNWRLHLLNIATQHSRHAFLRGRKNVLTDPGFRLKSSTRQMILHDLGVESEWAATQSDIELLSMAACKYDNYLARYNIQLHSQGSFLSRIFPLNLLVS